MDKELAKKMERDALKLSLLFGSIILIASIGFFYVSFSLYDAVLKTASLNEKSDLTCNDLETHYTAQMLFETDTWRYSALDGDGDGVACESLRK